MDSTKTLAVSLWQRAQLLITMHQPTEALADIKQALAEGLPPKHKGEAFWKMGLCHRARGETDKARVCFELAEKLLVDDDKEEFRKDLQKECVGKKGYENNKGGV